MTKALRFEDSKLNLVSVPVPAVSKSDEVVIRVEYSGVCGTDLQVMRGDFVFPCAKSIVLGHEFGGEITEVGDAVKNLAVGDKVAVNPSYSCGVCRRCVTNYSQFCLTGSLRLTLGFQADGGWAEYCRAPAKSVYKLPEGMTTKQAVLADPLACVLRGIERLSPVETTHDILICGAGTIGLLFASVLYHHGNRHITISEISESRRAFASSMGIGLTAKHPDKIEEEMLKAQDESNYDWGFDIVIDATGEPVAINQGLTFLRSGGKLCMFGTCPEKSTIQLNALSVVVKELSILGATNNPFTFTTSLQILAEDKSVRYSYEKLGFQEFELENYKDALEKLSSGKINKAVFKIHKG